MQLRRHQLKLKFEDDLRSGKMSQRDLFAMVEQGILPCRKANRFLRTFRKRRAWAVRNAVGSSFSPEFLRVWDASTANEKATLAPLLVKKRTAYFKKAQKDMTAQWRLSDPTYRRLRELFPQQAPW